MKRDNLKNKKVTKNRGGPFLGQNTKLVSESEFL